MAKYKYIKASLSEITSLSGYCMTWLSSEVPVLHPSILFLHPSGEPEDHLRRPVEHPGHDAIVVLIYEIDVYASLLSAASKSPKLHMCIYSVLLNQKLLDT